MREDEDLVEEELAAHEEEDEAALTTAYMRGWDGAVPARRWQDAGCYGSSTQ